MRILAKYLIVFVLVINAGWISLAQDNITTIHDATSPKRGVYWSTDGETIVILSDSYLEAWNVNSGEKVAETTAPLFIDIPLAYTTTPQRIAWSANGQYAAVANPEQSSVSIYERGNEILLYTIDVDESENFWTENVLWHPDAAIWIYQSRVQHDITFYKAEDGTVIGRIVLDPEQYVYAVSFYGLEFESNGNSLAVVRNSAGVSDLLVYDSNTLEENIIVEGHFAGTAGILTFQWLDQRILNYCINPSVDGPHGSPESESITHNLETGHKVSLPFCVGYISPDGKYTLDFEWWDADRNEMITNLNVIEISTGDVIYSLNLSNIDGVDLDNLFERSRFDWGMSGIVIYRGIPLTIWQPDLPDD